MNNSTSVQLPYIRNIMNRPSIQNKSNRTDILISYSPLDLRYLISRCKIFSHIIQIEDTSTHAQAETDHFSTIPTSTTRPKLAIDIREGTTRATPGGTTVPVKI